MTIVQQETMHSSEQIETKATKYSLTKRQHSSKPDIEAAKVANEQNVDDDKGSDGSGHDEQQMLRAHISGKFLATDRGGRVGTFRCNEERLRLGLTLVVSVPLKLVRPVVVVQMQRLGKNCVVLETTIFARCFMLLCAAF